MGNSSSNASSLKAGSWEAWLPWKQQQKEWRLLFHGLDAAGKTTLLYRLKLGEVVHTIPTIGFNVETIQYHGMEFVSWDVGGRSGSRVLWRHYYQNTQGLVFVVDSSDADRTFQARDEFWQMIQERELYRRPVLLLCNKQDLPKAWSPNRIAQFFRVGEAQSLRDGRGTEVKVIGCVATNAEEKNVWEGLEWLGQAIRRGEEDGLYDDSHPLPRASVVKGQHSHLDYDPTPNTWTNYSSLRRFRPIQEGTSCPFAKAAKLWGGNIEEVKHGPPHPLTEVAKAHSNALTEFVKRVNGDQDIKGENLDGFCIELDDPRALGKDPEGLGVCVRQMLTAISDLDPAKEQMMRVNYVGARGWRFRFAKMEFFVTTFAPCYPKTSSRYAFGTNRAFLLLQPEISFARHGLTPDTPKTEWEEPKTMRDKARVAFRKAGQPYFIPETTNYPMAEHIVKPLKDDGVAVVRWWQDPTNTALSKTRV